MNHGSVRDWVATLQLSFKSARKAFALVSEDLLAGLSFFGLVFFLQHHHQRLFSPSFDQDTLASHTEWTD